MTLRVFNTQTRKLEPFRPQHDRKVAMYVCGPTVYNYIHIGNARVFVFLTWSGGIYDIKGMMSPMCKTSPTSTIG